MRMRHGLAIAAFLGLLVGNPAVWRAAGCCENSACCKSGTCPLHRQKRAASPGRAPDQQMHCRHSTEAPAPESAGRCNASGECSHHAQTVYSAPAFRAVLAAAATAPVTRGARAERVVFQATIAPGFIPCPFEPPRA